MAFVVMGSGLAQMALAAPGDITWEQTGVTGIPGARYWTSVASSADGTKLVALNNNDWSGGYIYTSTDSGATWVERTGAGLQNWTSVASSMDGTKLVAGSVHLGEGGSYIYTSTDSGVTWTQQTAAGSREWYSVASSADGTKLVAGSDYYIYTSTDSGVTWTERTAAGSREWYSVASSADGTKLVAGEDGGYIYTSADSGATWTERTSVGTGNWYSIASSADGAKLAAAGGSIYTSTDSGATWTERVSDVSGYWRSITSSIDGIKLAATGETGYIFNSTNSGVTWTQQTAGSSNWYSIASSADGTKLVAGDSGGFLYLGSVEGAATDTFDLSSLPSGSQAATETAIRNAQISATSETCYTFDAPSIATLSAAGVSASEANVSILGGIAYNLKCTLNGGVASVEIALDAYYPSIGTLRIYKESGAVLTDVTDQVSLVNRLVSGAMRTVLVYTLTDGGDFDEDGTANSTIVDPIYIGVVNGTSAAAPAAGGSLANTGTSVWTTVAGGAIFSLAGVAILYRTYWRRGRVAFQR